MKKDRKLKLIVNKIKISNLNHVFGGNGSREETEVCAFTDVSCDTRCVDTNTDPIIETEICWTGDTKTINTIENCVFVDSRAC